MNTKITTPTLGTVIVPIENVASIMGTRFYSPSIPDVMPQAKPEYTGKNISGGRKCSMTTSKAYKNGYTPNAMSWSWNVKERFILPISKE